MKYEDYENEELKNIKVVMRWDNKGQMYVWVNPTRKKIKELIAKYGVDRMCDGCLRLW